tara:strand:- start:121 stop:396 length:276 start_codon:yes stop_codon:yes gene_type:complete
VYHWRLIAGLVSDAHKKQRFLTIKSGDYVVIKEKLENINQQESSKWWIGQIICCIGSARDSSVNSLFQICNIDTGIIKTINADLVIEVIKN